MKDENKVIEIKNVSKIYKLYDTPSGRIREVLFHSSKVWGKEYRALSNVSFDVIRGETFGIIGGNGAGKSTLLKIITGVTAATFGNIAVNGKVSALLELGAGFNQEYTGIENIYLNGSMMGYSHDEMGEKIQNILDFADIGDYAYQKVKTYSSGMFARLAFAVAINVEPEILIVDEALSVGDIYFQNKCYKKIEELRERGTTVLLVSHDMQTVRQMCTRVLWLDHGTVQMCGEGTEVCNAYTNSILKSRKVGEDSATEEKYQIEKLKINNFPAISYTNESILNPDVEIISCFIENKEHERVTECNINEPYTLSLVFQSKREIDQCIVGFVMETVKGLWIINSNSAICGEKGSFHIEKDSLNRVDFQFIMPALMKGEYIIGAAVSEGNKEEYQVLTWLYNIMAVNIINPGNNSGVIDVDTDIKIYSRKIGEVNE